MIIVFDLDDTLYKELSYVKSGFGVVAKYIETEYGFPMNITFSLMNKQLLEGRSNIFDAVFQSLGVFSKKLVCRCVNLYHLHKPQLILYPEAERCIDRFKDYPLYIVTDGNKNAQKNKLIALGLYDNSPICRCYLTYQYGYKFTKPSPYCFLKITKREGVRPSDVVYIADNPQKDFIGIKPLGFRTVRVLTGQHRHVRKEKKYDADYEIQSLDDLTEGYLWGIFNDSRRIDYKSSP